MQRLKQLVAGAWPCAAVVLACTALLGWVQFAFDGLHDTDSYFHTRAARELDRHGFQRTFPQAAFSTWSERYADKDLLFHLTLVPFQRLHGSPGIPGEEDLVTPGKQAAVVLSGLFFACFAAALLAVGARAAWLWIALLFLADAPLLIAFLPVRPGLLAMSFVVVEIALILRGRSRWLLAVGAMHAWAHSSFVILPALAAAVALAHLVRGEAQPRGVLAAAIAGPALGLFVNPYFPNDLFVAWDQLVEVAHGVWLGIPEVPASLFGSELVAPRTAHFLGSFPAFLPAVGAIVALLAYPARRLSTGGLALVLMAGALLAAGFLSERFLRFFFPVVVLAGARLWSELAGTLTWRSAWRAAPRQVALAAAVLAVSLAGGLSDGNVLTVRKHVAGMSTPDAYRPGVEFLRRTARPDDLVYHNFWWDFSILYHYRPDGRYVVALDPMFFYRHDPARFAKSLAAFSGQTQDLYRVLSDDFGARWVFVPKSMRYQPFFNLMRQDPRFQKAYEDDHVAIARLQ